VSARPNDSTSTQSTEIKEDDDDEDIKRAKDLLKYHYDVKEKHKHGKLSLGLERARRDVERVVGR
jgi:FAD synthase